jgi:hypothetical protein
MLIVLSIIVIMLFLDIILKSKFFSLYLIIADFQD